MKKALCLCSTLLLVCAVSAANAPQILAGGGKGSSNGSNGRARAFGTITGSVRDASGNPLSGVVVSLIRDGANQIVKQIRSGQDGSFSARIAPGNYSMRAIAEGFQEVLFSSVQVRASNELVYRFNLEPIGTGRSAPEQRKDRDDAKWIIRAAQSRRSIFQMHEGDSEVAEIARVAEEKAAAENANHSVTENSANNSSNSDIKNKTNESASRAQGVVETYAASTNSFASNYAGLNFAFAQPVNDRIEMVFSGQTGTSAFAPQRLQTTARVRTANNRHRLSLNAGVTRVAAIKSAKEAGETAAETSPQLLGQISAGAIDEWVARDGVVVVLGFDYSRFVGASQAQSISPRFGVQYDANARTRLRIAYAPAGGDEEANMSAAKFEDGEVVFKQPAAKIVTLAQNRKAKMERNRRFEFGVERVLDNSSSVEATAFFDTTNRGVGLMSVPLSAFANEAGNEITSIAQQDGAARGVRVVYARRINKVFDASAGYSFGRGQKLSPDGLTNPADVFSNGFFQSAAFQVSTDLDTGTRVQAVFRFSPRATVFAIDPFAGRLAVYDPSLSVVVTQGLPTFGLPVRAEAVFDARNLLDTQPCTDDGEARVQIGTASRRSVRGGLSVRF